MSAALGLHLVLDVHPRDAGPDILPHCACDIGRSTKAAWLVSYKKCGEGDSLPCIGVRNDRNGGLQTADHLRGLKSIIISSMEPRSSAKYLTPTKSFRVAIATSGWPSREAVVAAPLFKFIKRLDIIALAI